MSQKFVLKGVDIKKVYEDYCQGKYSRMPVPKGKINLPSGSSRPIERGPISSDLNQESYIVSLPSYGQIRHHAINTEAYQTFNVSGEPLIGGRCSYCGRDFDWHRMGIPLGIVEYSGEMPASMINTGERRLLLVQIENMGPRNSNCGYKCALSELDRRDRPGVRPSNEYYANSRRCLKQMFSLSYPGGTLESAPDAWLSKNFGGPLSDEQFHMKDYRFIRIPDIILTPVKGVYQQIAG
jgi:hypothetical protein